MPKIHRVRVSNIRYDGGKKQYPDITFDFHGKNAIVLLANGGGKTLLLQLIMQTVLPNEKINDRRIADLLQHERYTGQIAVEWVLDSEGDQPGYLCTGFCFTNPRPDDRNSVRYFTYLFDYGLDPSLTIESLPFFVEQEDGSKRPIQFQEMKDWLRERERQRVQVFDSIKEYQRRLRQFQVLPEEWKSIRDTNGTEGGVEKFFERSKTAQQLLEHLLIPHAEEVIYQTESRKKELVNAFQEHRKMLLEIPVIKQNISDFQVIRDHAETVLEEAKKVKKTGSQLMASHRWLERLGKTFARYQEESKKRAESLEQKRKMLEDVRKDLIWKIDSHRYYTQLLELEEGEKACRESEKEKNRMSEQLREAESHLASMQALKDFNEAEEAEQNLYKYSRELELLERKTPDSHRKLEKLKRHLRFSWKQEREKREGHKFKIEQENGELVSRRKHIEENLNESEQREESLMRELGRVEEWLRQYREKEAEIRRELGEDAAHSPQKVLDGEEASRKENRDEKQQLELKLGSMEEKKEQLEQKNIQLSIRKTEIISEKKNLDQQLSIYSRRAEELKREWNHTIGLRHSPDLFADKEELISQADRHLQRVQSDRADLQAELARLDEKWVWVEGVDYYVPHGELVRIQRRLEQRGVSAVLGAEWLSRQPLSEQEKEQILQSRPLLPYSILVEENQLNQVKRVMRQNQSWSADFPILFLVKSTANLSGSTEIPDFHLFTVGQGVYLYQPPSVKLYSGLEAFVEFKQRLGSEREELESRLKELAGKEKRVLDCTQLIRQFYREFSADQVQVWTRRENEIAVESDQLEEELGRIHRLKQELSTQQKNIRQELQQKEQEERIIEKRMGRLEEFLKWVKLLPDKTAEKSRSLKQIEELKQRMERLENELESIRKRQEEGRQRLRKCVNEIEKLIDDERRFRLHEVEAEPTNKEYFQCKADVETEESLIEKQDTDITLLKSLIEKEEKQREEARYRLERSGFPGEWLRENRREITRDELEEGEQQVHEAKEAEKVAVECWNQWQRRVSQWRGGCEECRKRVMKDHGREPFPDYSPERHDHQYRGFQKELTDVNKERTDLMELLEREHRWQDEYREQAERIGDHRSIRLEELPADEIDEEILPLTDAEWESLSLTPRESVQKGMKQWQENGKRMKEQKRVLEQEFQRFARRLQERNNPKLHQFVRMMIEINNDGRLYDYEFVETHFVRIYEALDQYEKEFQRTMEESEKNHHHLVQLCLQRAKTVHDSILEVPKSARVEMYDRTLQVIRIDWPAWEEEEGREKMSRYLEKALNDLQQWSAEGMEDDQLNLRMEEKLRTRNLLQLLTPLENCQVTVYKPRKESIARRSRTEYAPWDEVARWSGGENYSIYMTMFMVLISYIRRQTTGNPRAHKTIIADNPFGKASSPHILETVFRIAEQNSIQLICLTAHKDEDILARFPIVYSLQLQPAFGREVMKAEEIEKGFYHVDPSA